MSYHYNLGSSLSERATARPRTSKIKSAASAVKRSVISTITAPGRAVADAARSAERAADAVGAKADDAVELIREAKKKLEIAKRLFEKHQLKQEHWDKIDRLEAKVNKTIKMLPLTSRLALIKEFSKLLDMAFIAVVVALLGSTFALWFLFGREKKPKRPRKKKKRPPPKRKRPPPQEEYIEIAEGGEVPGRL